METEAPPPPSASKVVLESCMKGAAPKIKSFYEKNPDDLAKINELGSVEKGWTPLQVAKAWHAGRQLKLGGAAGAGVSQAVDGIAPSLATILAREPRPQPHPSNSAAAKQRPPRPGRVEPKLREPLGNGYMTVDPRSVKRLAPAPSPRDGLCSPFSAHTGQPLSARV